MTDRDEEEVEVVDKEEMKKHLAEEEGGEENWKRRK